MSGSVREHTGGDVRGTNGAAGRSSKPRRGRWSQEEQARLKELWGLREDAAIPDAPVNHVRVGIDAQLPDDAWRTICDVDVAGALLVRPDQHVAWRATTLTDRTAGDLATALTRILGDPT